LIHKIRNYFIIFYLKNIKCLLIVAEKDLHIREEQEVPKDPKDKEDLEEVAAEFKVHKDQLEQEVQLGKLD
jgi:hypothetical protein